VDVKSLIQRAKQIRGSGRESPFHEAFKNFIANNPAVIGLATTVGKGQTEYCLPSTDTIDILFIDNKTKIGVEVKSKISDTPDILRGFFQCIKYKSLIEAEQIINHEEPLNKVILALEGELPADLVAVRNIFEIEVIDNIKITTKGSYDHPSTN